MDFDRRILEELDSASQRDLKSYTDDTHAREQRVSTERITVSRHDITRTDEPEHPKYPKDLNIGRIVIEEIPEEKITKRESPQKERSKPKVKEIIKEETRIPRKEIIEREARIQKEFTDDYEERPWERRTVDERVTTYTDRVDGVRKVIILSINFIYVMKLLKPREKKCLKMTVVECLEVRIWLKITSRTNELEYLNNN